MTRASTLALFSFLATGTWLATMRLLLWDFGYETRLPFSDLLITAMAASYLILSPSFLLGIRRGLKISTLLSVTLLAFTLIGGGVFLGYSWSIIVLLVLEAISTILSIRAWRERLREGRPGLHPLDLPVFG